MTKIERECIDVGAILSSPFFYVGIIVCLVSVGYYNVHKKDRKRAKRRAMIQACKIIDQLIDQTRHGQEVDIAIVFSQAETVKNPEPPRYLAWKYLVYWITVRYASYDYNWQMAEEIHKIAAMWFGENTVAHLKLVALDEIINRSTKYLLDEHKNLYDNKPIETYDELFDMVDMIIDSIWEENY